MPDFDRAIPWAGSTLAFLGYRAQFTQLNGQYWGGVPSELLARRFFATHDAADDLRSALAVTADKWSHVGNSVQDYEARFAEHREWSRPLTLLLLMSCLERYLSAVAEAAVLSDPLLAPGFPKRVDGAMLLKHGYSVPLETEGVVKGEWAARVARYRGLFGTVPNELQAQMGELDRMRTMRNKIAHQFGVDEELAVPILDLKPIALSEERLTNWMGIVNGVVRSVDAHLRNEFVGDFETVRLYHMWTDDEQDLMRRTGVTVTPNPQDRWRPFKELIHRYVGRSANVSYFRSLASYFRALR